MPSNIALIKYMGKSESQSNLPSNPSLSYTLEHLRSFVRLEESELGEDQWQPLEGFPPMTLSEPGRQKFLRHFKRLKEHWKISGTFTVYSANNFPSDCGLASSASSFAALTQATALLARTIDPGLEISASRLSRLSRAGSGSSCRSFFTPWSVWCEDGAEEVSLDLGLEHAVLLIEVEKKTVSSSEAHQRVNSSALFPGRKLRAEERLNELLSSLKGAQWKNAFELCWAEFWDMHALFETSRPPFSYLQPGTVKALNHIREKWLAEGDGPLVTMDAGANVHLLFRKDQVGRAAEWLNGQKAITSWSQVEKL